MKLYFLEIVLFCYIPRFVDNDRISNERKCVNHDCSVPISTGRTLTRYNADDHRLLSFPKNVPVIVYSKEAGDNPTLWEVEIKGKRGYVPKDFIKEEQMLGDKKKVNLITVSTGQINPKPSHNVIDVNDTGGSKVESEDLKATPKLPLANIVKGLFSVMPGVSANSVPPNTDINPERTMKYDVVHGTTIYEEEMNDRPEELTHSQLDVQSTHSTNLVPSSGMDGASKEDIDTVKSREVKGKEHLDHNLNDNELIKQAISEKDSESTSMSSDSILESSAHKESKLSETADVMGEEEEEEDYEDDDDGGLAENGYVSYDRTKEVNDKMVKPDSPTSEAIADASEGITKIDSNTGNISNEAINNHQILINDTGKSLSNNDTSNVIQNKNLEDASFRESDISNKKNEVVDTDHEKSELQPNPVETEREMVINVVAPPESIDENGVQHSQEEQLEDSLQNIASTSDKLNSSSLFENKKLVEDVSLGKESSKEYPSNYDKFENQVPKNNTQQPENQNKSYQNQFKESTMSLIEKHTSEDAVNQQIVRDEGKGLTENDSKVELDNNSVDDQITKKDSALHKDNDTTNYNVGDTTLLKDTESIIVQDSGINSELPEDTDSLLIDNTSVDQINSEVIRSSVVYNTHVKKQNVSQDIKETNEDISHNYVEKPVNEEPESTDSPTPQVELSESESIGLIVTEQPSSEHLSSGEAIPVPAEDSPIDSLPSPTNYNPFQDSNEVPTEVPSSDVYPGQPPSKESLENYHSPNSMPDFIEEFIKVEEEIKSATLESDEPEGLFSWLNPFYNVFTSQKSMEETINTVETQNNDLKDAPKGEVVTHFQEEIVLESNSLAKSDESSVMMLDTFDSPSSKFQEEGSCPAAGIGEGDCRSVGDVPTTNYLESLPSTDLLAVVGFFDKIPIELTIWLLITALSVIVFSLGHYYIEAHKRDGPLVAVINKLERELLILKKENCILEDNLHTSQQQLEDWSKNSSENDAVIVDLKRELFETKSAKQELEEQVAVLEKEVESVTEHGLEIHRMLEDSLSSQDGSQALLATVDTLRDKLEQQDGVIAALSQNLAVQTEQVEELGRKLSQAAKEAAALEDKVITVVRDKEEATLLLKDQHRTLMSQLEEVMESKALYETRISSEMSKLRLTIEELQKCVAQKDAELEELNEVVKQLRSTDSNDKMDALFDVVGVKAKLRTLKSERDEFCEKFHEEEGARKLLEGHMKKITQEVAELKNSFETAEKEKIEALTKLQVLSNYFKEKESQLQKELGMQESMWLQKQSDDHTIYEQMRSLREENDKYKLQNESLKKEIVEQESSFKVQIANIEQKSHENWVASRQAERKLKEAQQESALLRHRLTAEKSAATYGLEDGKNISETNGDASSPQPPMMNPFPPTSSSPFMLFPPNDFVPPPPFSSDSRPPPLGRISSPPLDRRFSPPPPLAYPPYDYSPYGHHSPSPPPPLHRSVPKPQPRDHKDLGSSAYSPDSDSSTLRKNKR